MPDPREKNRRLPQNPNDGKGADRYSTAVGNATDAMEKHPEPDATNPVSIIAGYARLGESLRAAGNFREVAMEIAKIAELAETTVMEETSDWFDGHTVKRNMAELKKHAGAFSKLAEELDTMQQRASALYDDMGNVLGRYFEMAELSPISSAINNPEDKGPEGFSPEDRAPEFDGPGGNPADDRGREELDDDGEPFGGKKAAPFDGPGGNPEDDEGRRKHDAQDGVIDDDSDEDDDMLEGIVDKIMEKIVPTREGGPGSGKKKTGRAPKLQEPWQDPAEPVKHKSKLSRKSRSKESDPSARQVRSTKGKRAPKLERGGPDTPEQARKALRTPKSFARPHWGWTHDQAKQILSRTGASTVEEAGRVMEAASDKKKEAVLRKIVDEKQHARLDGQIVDLFSASHIVAVLDALNPANKAKYLKQPVKRMADIAFTLLKKK